MSGIVRFSLVVVVLLSNIWVSPLPAASAQSIPWHKGEFYLYPFHARQMYNQPGFHSGWSVGSTVPVTMDVISFGLFKDKPLTPGLPISFVVNQMRPLLQYSREADLDKAILGFDFHIEGKMFAQASWDNKQPSCHELDRIPWALHRRGSYTQVSLNLSGQRTAYATINNGPIQPLTNWGVGGLGTSDIRLYPAQNADLGFPCSTVWWDLPRNPAEPFIEYFEVRQGWALVTGREFLTDDLSTEQYTLTLELDGSPAQVLVTPTMFQRPSDGFWSYDYINFPWPKFGPIPQRGWLIIHVGEKTHAIRVLVVDGLVTVIR